MKSVFNLLLLSVLTAIAIGCGETKNDEFVRTQSKEYKYHEFDELHSSFLHGYVYVKAANDVYLVKDSFRSLYVDNQSKSLGNYDCVKKGFWKKMFFWLGDEQDEHKYCGSASYKFMFMSRAGILLEKLLETEEKRRTDRMSSCPMLIKDCPEGTEFLNVYYKPSGDYYMSTENQVVAWEDLSGVKILSDEANEIGINVLQRMNAVTLVRAESSVEKLDTIIYRFRIKEGEFADIPVPTELDKLFREHFPSAFETEDVKFNLIYGNNKLYGIMNHENQHGIITEFK